MRPDWDDYFLEFVKTASLRATCDRGKSGCIVVKNNRILVTGYVGAPSNFPSCDDVGHDFELRMPIIKKLPKNILKCSPFSSTIQKIVNGTFSIHCVRTLHAEINALLQAARMGVSLEGSTLYCTMTPCRNCALCIVQTGIVRVVCLKKYHHGEVSEKIFKTAGINFELKDETFMEYN